MKSSHSNLFIVFLVLSAHSCLLANSIFINVVNDLTTLSVSCMVDEIFAGTVIVESKGNDDIYVYTKANCNITSEELRFSGYFIVFDEKRDSKRCTEDDICEWHVNNDGLTLYIQGKQLDYAAWN